MSHTSPRYRPAVLTMMLATIFLTACDSDQGPPFSLGGAARVEEILSKYGKDDLMLPKAGRDTNLKVYGQINLPRSVLARKVTLYESEIVAEDILFPTRKQTPITGCEVVRSTVPWATKWTEGTVKQIMAPSFDIVEAPSFTASRPGWVAKVYGARGTARLVVVKLGIPGLEIDELVPGFMQKYMQEKMPEIREAEAKMLKERQEREREREAFDRGE